MVLLITDCCFASIINSNRDSVFFDSNDWEIIMNSKKVLFYLLSGSPVEDSAKRSRSKYIFNYEYKSSGKLSKPKYYEIISTLCNCNNLPAEIDKCTVLLEYCIKVSDGDKELLILFSKPGACSNFVKVVKINNINHHETAQTYIAGSLKTLLELE